MEKNVLILEDDAILSANIANIVRHALVAVPRVTASCSIAMEMMSENISFALLDLRVSDGTTHNVARALRAEQVPVWFLSGGDQRDMPEDLRSIGFVRKPANSQRLIRKIKALTADFDLGYWKADVLARVMPLHQCANHLHCIRFHHRLVPTYARYAWETHGNAGLVPG